MEIKNINEYKFIVSTGCSYGLLPNSVFKPFNLINRTVDSDKMSKILYNEYGKKWLEIQDKIIVLNVSLGSQGSDWQSDSVIYTIDKLLNLGVKPENIYCLVEWSQWSRFTVHPNQYELDPKNFDWNKDNLFFFENINPNDLISRNNEIVKELHNILKIRTSKPLYNVGKILNKIYLVPSSLDFNDFSKVFPNSKNILKKYKSLNDTYPNFKKVKNYLDNILKTQYYLKNNHIKYNFCFMQSSLSNWFKTNTDEFAKHDLIPPYISETESFKDYGPNKNFKPFNNPESDVEKVFCEFQHEISLIDFDKIWFYENEKFRRGGIDEWTIDNFKEVGYINLHEYTEEFFGPMDMICDYGFHPNTTSYLLLWNKISTECDFVKVKKDFEDFMLEKFWEDYNYDGYSKNYVTISKKEWIKRLNQ